MSWGLSWSARLTWPKRPSAPPATQPDLNRLLAQARVGLSVVSREGLLLYVNERVCELMGRPATELLGSRITDWLDPQRAAVRLENAKRLMAGETEQLHNDETLLRPDGRRFWVRMTGSALRDDAGQITSYLMVMEDISALKAEQASRLSAEQRLSRVLESMPDPFWIQDLRGHYLQCNQAFARLVGRPMDELVGATDADLFEPALAQELRSLFEGARASGVSRLREVCLTSRKPALHLDITVAPVTDDEGRCVAVMGLGRDISAQTRALAELRQAQQQAEALLAQAEISRQTLLSVVEDQQRSEQATRESQAFLEAVVRALPDSVMMIDAEGRISDIWSDPESVHHRAHDFLIGKKAVDVAEPAAARMIPAMLTSTFSQGRAVTEYFEQRDDGPHRYEARWSRVNERLALVMLRDVTLRYRAAEHQRLTAAVFEHAQEGVLIADMDWQPVSINRAFTQLFGYTLDDLKRLGVRTRRGSRQDASFYQAMGQAVAAHGHWAGEVWYLLKNGEEQVFWQSIVVVRDEAGELTHHVSVYTDISRLKDSEAKLEYLAHHDVLTRLPNRLFFMDRLEQALSEAGRSHQACAVLMLDLDHFKDINDSYGHLAGDELLRQVAQRLSGQVRRADTLARLGGDEFALLLDDVRHVEDAARLANDLIATLSAPLMLDNGVEVTVGASVGISLFPEHGHTPQDLLQGADAALYHAKGSGRGVFRYYSDEMTRAARARLELESRLRRALAMGELSLHYQPQVEIATGRIVGAEALLRWFDPVEGDMVSPARFIPVAEASGLIAKIGAWVLRESCRQGQIWRDAGLPHITLAVNVSPRQFHRVDLAAQVADVLRDTGFPAHALELELTEGALMEREADALNVLQRLRGVGVGVAIDDFGTGYSSLAYLRRFPLDVLKIDRSFIAEIPHVKDAMEIAGAIIAMGHSLGIKVLAEGVETDEQLAFLREKGCDLFQGYLRSKPVPPAEFAVLLSQGGAGAADPRATMAAT